MWQFCQPFQLRKPDCRLQIRKSVVVADLIMYISDVLYIPSGLALTEEQMDRVIFELKDLVMKKSVY